jgi:hypothetical protein
MMITGYLHTVDHMVKFDFDATAYFEQASLEEVIRLAQGHWGADCDAGHPIAVYFIKREDPQFLTFASYLALEENLEYEIVIVEKEALAWLLSKLNLALEILNLSLIEMFNRGEKNEEENLKLLTKNLQISLALLKKVSVDPRR